MTLQVDRDSMMLPMKIPVQKTGLVMLFAAAFFLCSFPVWRTGTEGHDSIYYQRMGLQWMRGEWGFTCPGGNHTGFFRPVYFAVSALFFRFFGIHDYTLKIINLASLALLIWLLTLTARQLKIRAPFSYFPAVFFLFLPATIRQSRIETPHLLSAVFTTLAFGMLLKFRGSKKPSCLVFSALSLHAAMGTHEELALLAPGFLVLLLMDAFRENARPLLTFLRQSALFSAAFFAPFLLYFFLWNPREILATLRFLQTFAPASLLDPEKHFPVMAIELMTARLGILTGLPWILFLYSHLAAQMLSSLKKYEPLRGAGLLIPPLVYCLLLDLVVTRNNSMRLVRVMIPLLPFVGLYFALQLQDWCQRSPSRRRNFAVAGFVIFATGYNIGDLSSIPSFAHYNWYSPQPFYRYQTVHRTLHDRLKEKIGAGEKVLIAPSSFNAPYDAFNLPFYFNGQSISLDRCVAGTADFETFVRQHRIRFIFIGKTLPLPAGKVSSCLIPAGETCSASRETEKLLEKLAPYQPVRMDFDNSSGTLYEIQAPSPG